MLEGFRGFRVLGFRVEGFRGFRVLGFRVEGFSDSGASKGWMKVGRMKDPLYGLLLGHHPTNLHPTFGALRGFRVYARSCSWT